MYESDTHVRLSHGDVEVLPQQLWLPMWPLVHITVSLGLQGLPTETSPHSGRDSVRQIHKDRDSLQRYIP